MFLRVGVATDDVGKNAAAIEAASRGIFHMPGDMYIDIFFLL